MISRVRGIGGHPTKALGLALGAWIISGLATAAHAGGHGAGGKHGWGEYGYGPHFNHRGHGSDFGPPFFTHGMGCGIPFVPSYRPLYRSDSSGSDAGAFGYSDYGPYSGAPPFPDVVIPRSGIGTGAPRPIR